MSAIKANYPQIDRLRFIGVGGPQMVSEGLDAIGDFSQLAINGFRDPLLRLPQLIKLFRHLRRAFVAENVDAFVGIDFNVFNFMLEASLKRCRIKTAHYVSPSVYAWRRGRIQRVARSADVLLCLFPFEPAFYKGTGLHAEYVGHPLADRIDDDAGGSVARAEARQTLGIDPAQPVLAILPGSRSSEVDLMLPDFLAAAQQLRQAHEAFLCVIPCLRPALREQVDAHLRVLDVPAITYDGDARLALTAADLALVKSGTSTLEAMLLRCPMVVSYRLERWTYHIAKHLVRTPYVALPNILTQSELVPELLQDAATPAALAEALHSVYQNPEHQQQEFSRLHHELRRGADETAARAVLRLASS